MRKPLNHETIARAMKEAAWVAKYGTREERSGKFVEPKTRPDGYAPRSERRK